MGCKALRLFVFGSRTRAKELNSSYNDCNRRFPYLETAGTESFFKGFCAKRPIAVAIVPSRPLTRSICGTIPTGYRQQLSDRHPLTLQSGPMSSPPEDSTISISEDLFPSTTPIPSTTIALPFSNLLSPPLLLQTNETECGGKLWPAGMVLAEHLLRHQIGDMRGKTMFVRSNATSTSLNGRNKRLSYCVTT